MSNFNIKHEKLIQELKMRINFKKVTNLRKIENENQFNDKLTNCFKKSIEQIFNDYSKFHNSNINVNKFLKKILKKNNLKLTKLTYCDIRNIYNFFLPKLHNNGQTNSYLIDVLRSTCIFFRNEMENWHKNRNSLIGKNNKDSLNIILKAFKKVQKDTTNRSTELYAFNKITQNMIKEIQQQMLEKKLNTKILKNFIIYLQTNQRQRQPLDNFWKQYFKKYENYENGSKKVPNTNIFQIGQKLYFVTGNRLNSNSIGAPGQFVRVNKNGNPMKIGNNYVTTTLV